MKYIAYLMGLLVFAGLTCSGTAFSETVYVRGLMKITMRTGPSVENKIISMIESGDSLEIIKTEDDWALVRTPDGKEGWVLSRFISSELPLVIVARQLKQENQECSDLLSDIKNKNSELSDALKKANAELSETRKTLNDVERSYTSLKREASEFLILKQKYEESSSTMQQQQERIQALEKSLGKEDVIWFVSGAGVLVVGMLLGMSARKKRKSSLL